MSQTIVQAAGERGPLTPRPPIHQTDGLLDAARDLIVEEGPRAAGIRAIAERSGAPSGSLYHRFGSRDRLVGQAWVRALRRFQVGFVAALATADPRDGVAEAARWSVTFALEEPADARFLLASDRRSILDAEPGADVVAELNECDDRLARTVARLAERLFGAATPAAVERVTYAMLDLPSMVVRRHLLAGTLDAGTADDLASAAYALVSGPLT